MEVRRLFRPDGWAIEDHPRGCDLRCMPWIGPIGPRVLLAITAIWLNAYVIGSFLRLPFNSLWFCLFAVMLMLLKHLLLYFAGWNPNRHIRARDGRVICLAGIFPEECLGSLRLSRSRHGRSRSRLVFTGNQISEVELIGEPGLPDAVASQLQQELLKRAEHAGRLVCAELCEPFDAIGLWAVSSVRGSPLAVSH